MTPGLGSLQFNINDEELRMFKNIFQILFQQSTIKSDAISGIAALCMFCTHYSI